MTADQFFEDLLQTLLKESASDLHLTVGRRPTLRIAGNLIELAKHPTLTPAAVKDIVFIMLNEAERERYLAEREFDFSYAYKDKARFRANVFFQRGYMGAALRYIPAKIRDFNELNLPPILSTLAALSVGDKQIKVLGYFDRQKKRIYSIDDPRVLLHELKHYLEPDWRHDIGCAQLTAPDERGGTACRQPPHSESARSNTHNLDGSIDAPMESRAKENRGFGS